MTDRMRVSGGVYAAVVEIRARELLEALQSALAGDPHWRTNAQALLRSIANLEVPEPMTEALRAELREVDARKREAEIKEDLRNG
jgi:hypothetical protein